MDAPQIQQVLVNLFINAIQAMDQGGDLFIDISLDQEHDLVMVTVRDTGTGIKKDILPYIFDPFFTTKEHQRHRSGIVRELRHHPAAPRGNRGGERRGAGHRVYD